MLSCGSRAQYSFRSVPFIANSDCQTRFRALATASGCYNSVITYILPPRSLTPMSKTLLIPPYSQPRPTPLNFSSGPRITATCATTTFFTGHVNLWPRMWSHKTVGTISISFKTGGHKKEKAKIKNKNTRSTSQGSIFSCLYRIQLPFRYRTVLVRKKRYR